MLMRVPDCASSVSFTVGVKLAADESAWIKDVRFLRAIPLLRDGKALCRPEVSPAAEP